MTKLQPSLLAVTRALSNCARAANFDFGADTAIVAVQHMLWQTIDLFEAITALGVSRENIFALGKVYSNSPSVIGTLRDRGITIVENTVPEAGEFDAAFQQDANRLWEVVTGSLTNRQIKRILVLDDGGMCITSIPDELLRRYAVCGVEQTSFGIFLFQEKPPPFAVMSWARTAVKLQIGGPIFSHCLLVKLQIRFLGNTLANEEIGIIGLGSIGTALANLLVRQQNKLLFYDPDPQLHVPRYLEGQIARVDSVEELMLRSNYVFGCSGRAPFKNLWPLQHRPGVKLFSASGGDQEFGPIIDDLKTKPGFSVAPVTWDISSANGPSGPLFIAYLGFPYNFVARDIEAVPTNIVQIETAGLLASLIQARIHLALSEDGRTENRGIHRISLAAQRFVYETWLMVMKGWRIDLHEVYGYDVAMLEAARNESWFEQNSEPLPGATYEPSHATEDAMARLVRASDDLPLSHKWKFEPDLRSF